MSEKLTALLTELRCRLVALYGERLVQMILFGSQARGAAERGSDIDVLVVLRGEVSPCDEIARTIEDVADVSPHHNEVVSYVFALEEWLERQRSPLLLNIRREDVPV